MIEKVCFLRTLYEVKHLVERALDKALCLYPVHGGKLQCKVTVFFRRKVRLARGIVKLILTLPHHNGHLCLLHILRTSKAVVLHKLVVSHDACLHLWHHALRRRTVIVAVHRGEYGTLRLGWQSIEYLFQPLVAVLEYALVHDALQVVGCFCSKVAFAVKRALVLGRGDVALLVHPFQYGVAVLVNELRETCLIVR